MKSALLIALVAVLVFSLPAAAQNRIELYADAGMTTCSISEPVSPPVVQVHVFLAGSAPATGVRFKMPLPSCWVGATWLGDAVQPGVFGLGTSQTDWSLAITGTSGVVGCSSFNTPPVYLGWVSYLISGQALSCCVVDAVPAAQFVFTDCDFAEHPLEPSKPIVVNPNETCGCQSGSTLATDFSTWGRVKSLYR